MHRASCTRSDSFGQDPIGFKAGDENLYRYVRNGPGNGVDPDGLKVNGLRRWFDRNVRKPVNGWLDRTVRDPVDEHIRNPAQKLVKEKLQKPVNDFIQKNEPIIDAAKEGVRDGHATAASVVTFGMHEQSVSRSKRAIQSAYERGDTLSLLGLGTWGALGGVSLAASAYPTVAVGGPALPAYANTTIGATTGTMSSVTAFYRGKASYHAFQHGNVGEAAHQAFFAAEAGAGTVFGSMVAGRRILGIARAAPRMGVNELYVHTWQGAWRGQTAAAGRGGRVWATPYSASELANMSRLQRVWHIGRGKLPTDSVRVTGDALNEFVRVRGIGPFRLGWKRAGGQYFSRGPGSVDLTTGVRIADSGARLRYVAMSTGSYTMDGLLVGSIGGSIYAYANGGWDSVFDVNLGNPERVED